MKKLSIGITGASGSLGQELLKNKRFNFIKYNNDIRSKSDLKNGSKTIGLMP